jgi:hypothetical protein
MTIPRADGTRLAASILPLTAPLISLMLVASEARGDLMLKVPALVNGKQENSIGQVTALTVTIKGDSGAEGAFFKLDDGFKFLMNDAKGCQFRWFQVMTQNDDPPVWKGKPPPSYPFVDGPSGGWDYERDPPFKYKSGKPGGDTVPFYENDDDFTPNKNSYPLYKDVHSQKDGVVKESDGPGLPRGASSIRKFETYLVFVDPMMRKAMQFDVLVGFGWEIGLDKDKKPYAKGSEEIKKLDLAMLNKSLEPSGFKGWEAKTGLDIGACAMASPEPDSRTIVLVGSLGAFAFFYRRGRCRPKC